MVLVIATAVFAYLIDAFLVGTFLVACKLRCGWRVSNWLAPFILMVVFAFLDTYWIPAVTVLDARIVIGNSRVAKALGVSGEFPVTNFLSIGWFDVLVWGAQVIVAAWVAGWLLPRRKVGEQ